MFSAVKLATAVLAVGISVSCAAQGIPNQLENSDSAKLGCELHVWPGAGLKSVYYGWTHGGIVNGAVTGRDGYPQVPAAPIETAVQVKLLADVQPQRFLNRPNTRLVMHDVALPSRTIRTSLTRLGSADAQCYSELIVEDVFFQQDVFTGSYLKTLFRFRDFQGGQSPIRTFGTWVQTRLQHVPAKTAEDAAMVEEELQAAFSKNIAAFADALMKPPKAKAGR